MQVIKCKKQAQASHPRPREEDTAGRQITNLGKYDFEEGTLRAGGEIRQK